MSPKDIKTDLNRVGLHEVSGEMTRSLFIVPTYYGTFGKAPSKLDRLAGLDE